MRLLVGLTVGLLASGVARGDAGPSGPRTASGWELAGGRLVADPGGAEVHFLKYSGAVPLVPDSTGAPDPQLRTVGDTVHPDTTTESGSSQGRARVETAARGPSRFDAPRWVMLRSMLVPGWGQFHNRSWLKAAAVAAGEIELGLRLIDDSHTLDRLSREANAALDAYAHAPNAADSASYNAQYNALVEEHNKRLDSFTSRQWLGAALFVYAMVDAYVDAHFRRFKLEFEGDPALPGGKPASGSVRVALRWSY